MSHFPGLSEDVHGIILVGAEGCYEIEGEPWIREATEEEKIGLEQYIRMLVADRQGKEIAKKYNFRELYVDHNNRPYWCKAVIHHSRCPEIAAEKARRFTRALRVHVIY